jgi:2-dehydro-3-deoxygluconokinase
VRAIKSGIEVVTLGEAMLRLSPPGGRRLEQATSLELFVGGAELSVAIGVARLGLHSAWVTKLHESALGRIIANHARGLGVDVSKVVWTGSGRTGLYFLEFGGAPRPASVLYDRKGSAASKLAPGDVDWKFLKEAKMLHVSGITPALSPPTRELTFEAVKAAKRYGCEVCFDVNYRSKLWGPEEAEAVCTPLAKMADIVIASDAAVIWNIAQEPEEMIRTLKKKLGVPIVVTTLRKDSGVMRSTISSVAISERKYESRRPYDVEVADRLGAGDSFAAGLIYGYLTGGVQKGLDYGDAMAAYKVSTPGDSNYATKEEIDALIASGPNLRIRR